MTAAVDQNQRALCAETAKIEQVKPGDADAEARVLLCEGAAQLGQVVQRVADVGLTLLQKAFAGDRGDRHGRIEVRTADARAGDDDGAFGCGFCRFIGSDRFFLCDRGHGAEQGESQGGAPNQQASLLHDVIPRLRLKNSN